MSDIHYRLLTDPDDLRQAEDLQRFTWGENVIAWHMLFSLAKAGCPIIGAFDGDLLVGFSVAFYGLDAPENDRPALANLKLASKRLAVHPDYRSAGIGYRLKLEQKAFADKQAIRLITWTFDPLNSRNAYLYIRKLGTIARRFVPQYYAEIPGQVDELGYSDRMICEWWMNSNRVEERINGSRKPLGLKQYLEANTPIMNPSEVGANDLPIPAEGSFLFGESHLLLVEIPADMRLCYEKDEGLARSWREHGRSIFQQVFMHGFIATDFLYEEYEGRHRGFYVFGFDGARGISL